MMRLENKTSDCKKLRTNRGGLFANVRRAMMRRLADHITGCARCQQRLAKISRVELAMQLVVSQPHSLSLLQQANARALNMLRCDQRQGAKADSLRTATPQPDWTSRNTKRLEKLLSAAACLAVICLLKVGVFSSLNKIREDGETVIHNYYARNLDDDLMNELFDEPTKQA